VTVKNNNSILSLVCVNQFSVTHVTQTTRGKYASLQLSHNATKERTQHDANDATAKT